MDGLAVDAFPVGGAFIVGEGVEEGFAEGGVGVGEFGGFGSGGVIVWWGVVGWGVRTSAVVVTMRVMMAVPVRSAVVLFGWGG